MALGCLGNHGFAVGDGDHLPGKKFAGTVRSHRELLLNYFRATTQFSSGVIGKAANRMVTNTSKRQATDQPADDRAHSDSPPARRWIGRAQGQRGEETNYRKTDGDIKKQRALTEQRCLEAKRLPVGCQQRAGRRPLGDAGLTVQHHRRTSQDVEVLAGRVQIVHAQAIELQEVLAQQAAAVIEGH